MIADHQTERNHIFDALNLILLYKSERYRLRRILYSQLDSCTRENEIKYSLGYVKTFTEWGMFEIVEAGFLPVWHTREGISQGSVGL